MNIQTMSRSSLLQKMFGLLMVFVILTSEYCLASTRLSCKPCTCYTGDHGLTADCNYKHLKSIPEDLPSDVTTLLLGHNNISNLPSNFSGLYKLCYLDLSNNNLSRLRTKTFVNLPLLVKLSLEGNKLPLNSSGYPRGVFYGLNNLRYLRLNNNVKSGSAENMNYPSEQLAELSVLEELYIDGLPNSVFGPELKYISTLTNLTMSGETGYCNISNITEHYFTNIKNLQFLNLTKCDMRHINNTSFADLTNISTIDISHNDDLGIENVLNMLQGIQRSPLKCLYINDVMGKTSACLQVPKQFGEFLTDTPLKELYADNNYIVTAELGTIESLPKCLEVLSIRKSKLEFGQYFLELLTMSSLRKVDLSEMKVGEVLPEFFWNENSQNGISFPLPPKLEEFYSEDSSFRVAFVNVNFSANQLKVINYRNNVIKEWKGPMYGFDNLEEIDLSENFCDRAAPGCLKGFLNLKILKANSNYLGSFLKNDTEGQVFGYNKKLTFLDLSLNKIDDLPVNVFRGQINLRTLNLSQNSISNITFRVSHMTNLTCLNLMSNQISSLSHNFVSQLDGIRKHSNLEVDLSKNPFFCSCVTMWFIRWMTLHKTMFKNRHLYSCSLQSGWMSGYNVFDVLPDLEAFCTSHLGLAMGLLAAVTSVVCLVFAAITYRYRWKLRYLYYVARGRYRGHAIVGQGNGREYDYDAFVSYADEDRHFALHTFIRKVENESNIHLCLHHRDFLPGESIAANILSAIQRSRRVVMVLSPNFLNSYWCRWEFEMARMESLYTERNMVVLVKYQEVIPRLVPRDMMYMMHTQTYLEFPPDVDDEDTFWTALRQAITAP